MAGFELEAVSSEYVFVEVRVPEALAEVLAWWQEPDSSGLK